MRSAPDSDDLENLSIVALLELAEAGNQQARDVLYERYLPRLRRWALGRFPRKTEPRVEMDRVVEKALHWTLDPGERSHREHRGAFLGQVRRSIDDRVVDELRKADRRRKIKKSAKGAEAPRPSPVRELLDGEKCELYEAAFRKLELGDQVAILARIEEGLSYEEVALELGESSTHAAREAVSRALVRLAREMSLAKPR